MRVFTDTSALYALLDEADANHAPARTWLDGPGRDPATTLVTHSYVMVESAALLHRRLGSEVARLLLDVVEAVLSVFYVDEALHNLATHTYRASLGRRASLVDSVSFEMMREQRIERAFAFDRDFATEGFELVPRASR